MDTESKFFFPVQGLFANTDHKLCPEQIQNSED